VPMPSGGFSPERVDLMAVVLARCIRDGETVFHGVASVLPMVATLLARECHAPHLVYLNIPGGVDARPEKLPASTVGPELAAGARAQFSLIDIFDLSARGKLDLTFLGGAQIDAEGNINLSYIGDWRKPTVRLPGGAGSASILPTARRAVLWRTAHDRRVFVPRCDFVTACGRVDRVVTPLCVFKKVGPPNVGPPNEGGRLLPESLHPGVTIEELADRTGFDPGWGNIRELHATPHPTEAELAALRRVDPDRVRDREFA
ncbi:MAG: CoA-transferase subunit beta, partial [Nitrospinota bacterium]